MKSKRLIVAIGLSLCGCAPTGYFVSNVYRDNNDLYVKRCPIYENGQFGGGDTFLDSKNCKYERVPELPPEARAAVSAPAK